MDKSSRTNGGNGRSLCNHHPSGASSYSFTRACNELARVYHAARESYLLERNVITSHTFLCTTGQHHPVTLPMLKKQDTRSTRTSIKEKNRPFFFLPLDIHTPTITYGIWNQWNYYSWRDPRPSIPFGRRAYQRDNVYLLLVQSIYLADETGSPVSYTHLTLPTTPYV